MKHILVIRLSAMGDVAMTVPAIRALTEQHQVRVTVVSRPFFEPFFKDIKNVAFFAVDTQNRHKGFFGLYRLFQDLKTKNVDYVADLHNVLRSKIVGAFFKLSGKKVVTLDKGRQEKKALTRPENKTLQPLKPMYQRYADVFTELGFKVDLSNPKFPEKKNLSREVVENLGGFAQKNIGIAPFAQYDTKTYPIDLMQQVIDKLSQNPENKMFLFGGKADLPNLEKLQNHHQNVVITTGKLSFEQELQLISQLDVMLSMDSGNAHIASMYGVKTIVLFGATHPFLGFMPFGQPFENALIPDLKKYPKLPTSVYGNKIVEGYQDVMRTISPDEVVAKI